MQLATGMDTAGGSAAMAAIGRQHWANAAAALALWTLVLALGVLPFSAGAAVNDPGMNHGAAAQDRDP